jgi:hypothetical protein
VAFGDKFGALFQLNIGLQPLVNAPETILRYGVLLHVTNINYL